MQCFRQYQSALVDLSEALKLAPDNRELRHLIARVKEESRDKGGPIGDTDDRAGGPTQPPSCLPGVRAGVGVRGIPDIVPTTPTTMISEKCVGGGGVLETKRRKEETAL